MIELYQFSSDPNIKQQTFEQLTINFQRLSETIDYLVEIVKIQTDVNKQKSEFELEVEISKVQDILKTDIQKYQATFDIDVTACPKILYVGAYLQSILLNLISNAIKYRHPDRKPHIHM